MINAQDIQANILKFHGRPQAAILLGTFGTSTALEIRQWLKSVTTNYITSFTKQLADTEIWKNTSPSIEAPIVTLALSSECYKKAGFDSTSPAHPKDNLFAEGFNAYSSRDHTVDSYHTNYAPNYNTYEQSLCDVMILISHSLPSEIEAIQTALTNNNVLQDYWIEEGLNNTIPGRSNYSVGPLGFTDGLSTPVKLNTVAEASIVDGVNPYQNNGSYLAFRKMRTNKSYWSDLIKRIAVEYNVTRELAGAMLMGRFRNGTPLALHQKPVPWNQWQIDGQDISFNYQANPDFCPVGAHVRVANPRDKSNSEKPIIRRSMSYNSQQESGLLFMSYQASITNQLLPVLKRIKHERDLLLYAAGKGNPKHISFPNYVKAGEPVPRIKVNEDEMPILRGGEYFFCPPISFLQNIDNIN